MYFEDKVLYIQLNYTPPVYRKNKTMLKIQKIIGLYCSIFWFAPQDSQN